MTVFYVSPTGSGSHSGTSTANAATIYDLPRLVATANAGDEVRLLADRGAYNVTRQITIAAGGAAGAPVTVRGVDSSGTPMKATIVGTRAAAWKPGLNEGIELFRLVTGADHLAFTDLAVKNVGNGAFRIGADLSDLAIKRVSASNVSRFLENQFSSPATSASVNGLLVEDVSIAGYSQNAIRLKYNSRNVTLHNVVGDSMKQDGGLIIAGVALDGTVHDVLFDHVTMKNNYGHGLSSDYWNGDGFVAEGGTYNLTFRDTVASGNTDAGYDIKGNNITMIRASASGNNKNFRLWGKTSVTVADSVSTNPIYYGGIGKTSHAHFTSGSDVTFSNFRYSDTSGTTEIFDLSNGANTLRLVNMLMPAIGRIHFGNNSVIKLPNGLVVNGTSGNDWISGSTGNDMMIGGKGDDTYIVNHVGDRPIEDPAEGADHVRTSLLSYTLDGSLEKLTFAGTGNFGGYGNWLNNTITGGAGNDWLDGGTGNDVLTGGEGADSYWYERGDGNDTIYNGDSGGADRLVFAAGIAENQLWFAQNGSDLLVTLRGTGSSDTIRVKDWYTNAANRLSTFKLSDGSVLDVSRVQQLVQAMAKFTSSSGAPMTLSGTQSQTVEAVIAANWQSS